MTHYAVAHIDLSYARTRSTDDTDSARRILTLVLRPDHALGDVLAIIDNSPTDAAVVFTVTDRAPDPRDMAVVAAMRYQIID